MDEKGGLPVVSFPSGEAWDAWLSQGGPAAGVWLRIAKKGAGVASVGYPEAVEIGICHGWIDGQKAPLDERFWLQKFTPRRARSRWSQRNRDIAARLIEDGRMTPAGLAEVEAARADGRWERAYAPASTATVPDDLRTALDARPRAAEEFGRLDAANRYAILYRVQDAKRPETRARRIATFVEMLNRGERLHP